MKTLKVIREKETVVVELHDGDRVEIHNNRGVEFEAVIVDNSRNNPEKRV